MNYFFIGIGGAGMSCLAGYLLQRGESVAGSDTVKNDITERLQLKGANITADPERLCASDVIVYSQAIPRCDPILEAARKTKAKLMSRDVLLGSIFNRFPNSIAVAGTHGKTTVTALTAHIFDYSGLSPTAFIGGEVKPDSHNYICGNGDICIAEACEYKRSFLRLSPTLAVILNIDLDHTDCYADLQNLHDAFNCFADGSSDNATILLHESCRSFIQTDKKTLCFGYGRECTFRASNLTFDRGKYNFDVIYKGKNLCRISHNFYGRHNIMNILAAFACSYLYGIDELSIAKAIESFPGIKRRADLSYIGNREIITDYAHHPTQIKALIQSLSEAGKKDLTAVFQPHTYSRTKSLLKEFAECFYGVKRLILLPVFAARELPEKGGTSMDLFDKIKEIHPDLDVTYVSDMKAAAELISQDNNTLLVIGAGDVINIKKYLY